MQPFSNDYGGGYGGGNGYEEQQPQQEIPMRTQGVARPMVDPEAMGEVDPTLYVCPKSFRSTTKLHLSRCIPYFSFL